MKFRKSNTDTILNVIHSPNSSSTNAPQNALYSNFCFLIPIKTLKKIFVVCVYLRETDRQTEPNERLEPMNVRA